MFDINNYLETLDCANYNKKIQKWVPCLDSAPLTQQLDLSQPNDSEQGYIEIEVLH